MPIVEQLGQHIAAEVEKPGSAFLRPNTGPRQIGGEHAGGDAYERLQPSLERNKAETPVCGCLSFLKQVLRGRLLVHETDKFAILRARSECRLTLARSALRTHNR